MPKISAVILFALLLSTSCKKHKIKTAEDYIVNMGNQSFGAYVNGQPWVADYRDAGSNYGPLDISMFWRSAYRYNFLTAKALKSNGDISIYLPPPLIPGRVLLNSNTIPYPSELSPKAYGMYYNYSPDKRYITTANVTGYVDVIKCDTVLRTIEARFEFEAINELTNEKIKITNGYFRK